MAQVLTIKYHSRNIMTTHTCELAKALDVFDVQKSVVCTAARGIIAGGLHKSLFLVPL